MERIDAHCHFWRLERGDYGWLEGSGGPLQPIRRDVLPEDYPDAMDCIAVQAAPSEAETDFLLDLAKGAPGIAGVVGWLDLSDDAAVATLDRWGRGSRLRGLRPMLQDIEETEWLTRHASPAVLRRMAERSLVFDALVTERHLPMLQRFADAHPDIPIVIDHAAKPQPDRGEGWAEGMKALAGRPHVHCKLSGLLTELAPAERAEPLPALERIVAPLLQWFGPDRLIWGSDWPVLTLAASFQQWREMTERLLTGLGGSERAAIFGGNARRIYGLSA